jgi:hypothetical protein
VVTESFRRRWRFFQGRTGCVGREATAAYELAKAELWRQQQEDAGRLRVRWVWDRDGLDDWGCQCGCSPREVLGCIVETRSAEDADACPHGSIDWCECDSWQPAASLWGIGDPDRECRRIVEAGLCLELMALPCSPEHAG